MSKKITSEFFKKYRFSKPIRFWDKKLEQFSIYYKIEGYDCDVLIRPLPQTVPNDYNKRYDDSTKFFASRCII